MKKRAIISVFDKTGVLEFASELVKLGYEIVSTGGTAAALKEGGIAVTSVSDITGFPECLDGRVKTLHPFIHAGILAMRADPGHMRQVEELGITLVDIIAINLYPFKATIMKKDVTLDEAIENIDIGGPAMIRAAAKNWRDVTVIVDPGDYREVLYQIKNAQIDEKTRFRLAGKVFEHTAAYDALISDYLQKQRGGDETQNPLTLTYELAQELRYGENPHQKAAFYKEPRALENVLAAAKQLHGKELSFNNINDLSGALDVIKEFGEAEPCAVAVKHANPCGVGVGSGIYSAYMNAYNADPVSIYGGIVALNREVDAETAEQLSKTFLEIIIAPSFSPRATELLTQKKNIRLLELPGISKPYPKNIIDIKKVAGGLLLQNIDQADVQPREFKYVTERRPDTDELRKLVFAQRVVKHVKSNAIVLAKEGMTVGVGPGQTNRVTALEIAIKYAGDKAKGAVMASDAYFPFDDCVKLAARVGITAIIQPGGSVRDADSIKACNEAGIAMVFTGIRHFKH